jgi:hypothetical protein
MVVETTETNINKVFKLPIRYNDQVQKLNDTVINDLELINTFDNEEVPIYNNVFNPTNKASSQVIEQFSKYYTTDLTYLKETQQLTKQIDVNNPHFQDANNFDINDVVSSWEEIKAESGFCEKYLYIDWEFAKHLNKNSNVLQLMSIYNIASPIFSLCLPIIVLIIPFFIIKLKGIHLGIKEYVDILKQLISNHSIYKMFTQFNQVDNTNKIYLVISSTFYLLSIYQNILTCVRFYSNMQKIHNYLFKFNKYINHTLRIMDFYLSKTNELTKYAEFNESVLHNKKILYDLRDHLNKITPFSFSISKITEIGNIMHIFYQMYDDAVYNDCILFSFGFNGYFNILCHTASNIHENKLTKTKFVTKGKPIFKQMYYPKYINETNNVKNDCNLNKNMIITGPNASGKTTTLKSALINILLSQQIGFGCFDSLTLKPYDNIHCYLNIPDTSGRDSLFQAEARRCKEIIDSIDEQTNKTHFCIFDELYSGTNPDEAVVSANAFMDYIVKNKNVTCMLTTHYIKLCKKLAKNKKIQNCNMKTIKQNDTFDYTYKLESGISDIKGGIKVLVDMKYPKEIIDLANKNEVL